MNKKYNLLVCDNCKQEFILTKELIKEENKLKVDGEKLYLTYFECPHCGEIYKILLDNDLTLVLKNEYQKAIRKMQEVVGKYKGERLEKEMIRQQSVIDRKKKKLDKMYKSLNRRYNGKFYSLLKGENKNG